MALIAFDGFDNYATAAEVNQRRGALQWSGGGGLVTGRNGLGKALVAGESADGSVTCFASINANLSAGYFGMAMSGSFTIEIIDGTTSTTQCYLNFSSIYGTITAYNGSGSQIGQSLPNAFNGSLESFFEFHVVVGASGTLEVRVDNAPALTLDGVNTQHSSAGTFSAVGIGSSFVDDFRINDTTTGPGAYPNNSWLGDLRVIDLQAISNGSVAWTPLTGTNWQEIAETLFDGDTSYNSTTTVGAEDLLNFSALANTIDQIVGVQLMGAYRENDASTHTVAQHLSIGGTDYAGTARQLAVTYAFLTDLYPVNPATNASWTLADVNSILAGYALAS